MPRTLTGNGRVELRLKPEDKATLSRAAAIKQRDLTGYILDLALPKAEADIAEAERLALLRARLLAGARPARKPARRSRTSRVRRQGRLPSAVTGLDLGRNADRQETRPGRLRLRRRRSESLPATLRPPEP